MLEVWRGKKLLGRLSTKAANRMDLNSMIYTPLPESLVDLGERESENECCDRAKLHSHVYLR
jgi:hypothetical protein